MKKDSAMVKEIKEYVGKEVKGLKEYVCEYVGKEVKGLKEYVDQKLDSGIDEAKRHIGVVVEGFRSEVKIIAEQYGSIINRFTKIETKLEEHDLRFDRIDLELKGMKIALFDNSHRLDDHDTRIRKLELRN